MVSRSRVNAGADGHVLVFLTARMVTGLYEYNGTQREHVSHPIVRILAHRRGRITGSRAGVIADWHAVFASAAERCVAIEIDGDPARQDLDHASAVDALAAGCLFALDSDAHTTKRLSYAEAALAHARLAGIPAGANRELLAARPASGLAGASIVRARA